MKAFSLSGSLMYAALVFSVACSTGSDKELPYAEGDVLLLESASNIAYHAREGKTVDALCKEKGHTIRETAGDWVLLQRAGSPLSFWVYGPNMKHSGAIGYLPCPK